MVAVEAVAVGLNAGYKVSFFIWGQWNSEQFIGPLKFDPLPCILLKFCR